MFLESSVEPSSQCLLSQKIQDPMSYDLVNSKLNIIGQKVINSTTYGRDHTFEGRFLALVDILYRRTQASLHRLPMLTINKQPMLTITEDSRTNSCDLVKRKLNIRAQRL